jgi:hypothetical protein
MPRYKQINNERVQFTAAEETARDNEETQAAIDSQAIIDAATDAATKKASGKQKLKDLGLDDDEIKALTGA